MGFIIVKLFILPGDQNLITSKYEALSKSYH